MGGGVLTWAQFSVFAILFSSRLLSNLSAVNLRLPIMVAEALPEL